MAYQTKDPAVFRNLAKAQRAKGNEKAAKKMEDEAARLEAGGGGGGGGGGKKGGKKGKHAKKDHDGGGGGGGGGKGGGKDGGKGGKGQYGIKLHEETNSKGRTTYRFSGTKRLANLKGLKGGGYIHIASGKVVRRKDIAGRGPNPSFGTGHLVIFAGGFFWGRLSARLSDRLWATMQDNQLGAGGKKAAELESEHTGPWYGRQALTRIGRRPNARRVVPQLVTGGVLALLGAGLTFGTSWVGWGVFLLGWGGGHLSWAFDEGALNLLAKTNQPKTGKETTMANRLVADYSDAWTGFLDDQIDDDLERDPNGYSDDFNAATWETSGYPANLTPNRLLDMSTTTTSPGAGGDDAASTTKGLGAPGGPTQQQMSAAEQRLLEARRRAGIASPSSSKHAELQRAREQAPTLDGLDAPAALGDNGGDRKSCCDSCGKGLACEADCPDNHHSATPPLSPSSSPVPPPPVDSRPKASEVVLTPIDALPQSRPTSGDGMPQPDIRGLQLPSGNRYVNLHELMGLPRSASGPAPARRGLTPFS